ncbi:MAG TPA: hypothetical protein VFQ16_10570 [Burkholderiaceae bacterium]|nr:hypothetical protein [Burkholderiaceae bacterium]
MGSTAKFLAALCLAFAAHGAFAQSDAQLRAKLVGVWQETRQLECEEHRQRMQLRADGTFEVAGFVGRCNALSAFVWRGTWRVVQRKFIYTTTYSNPAELYPNGETFSDQIVSVTDKAWEMVEQSTGNRSIATRVK